MNIRIIFAAFLPSVIFILLIYTLQGCESKTQEVVKTLDQIKQDSIDLEIKKIKDPPIFRKIGSFKTYDGQDQGRDIYVITIDSCEYIGDLSGRYSDIFTHKGNCKYCEARKKIRGNKKYFPGEKVKDTVSLQ